MSWGGSGRHGPNETELNTGVLVHTPIPFPKSKDFSGLSSFKPSDLGGTTLNFSQKKLQTSQPDAFSIKLFYKKLKVTTLFSKF